MASTTAGRDYSTGLVQLLSGSRQGRALTNHLASVSVKLANGPFDSSLRQCASMRRVVLEGLRNRASNNLFRLPAVLPKAIVVANLAGEWVLLYEDGYDLIGQMLNVVTAHAQRSVVRAGVETMINFVKSDSSRLLLLCYCLPAMEDASSMHWELRSVTASDTKVVDGARHFAKNQAEPSCGTPTNAPAEPAIVRAELHALQNHVVAIRVDQGSEPTAETNSTPSGSDTANKELVLRNTISALHAERNKQMAEIRAMRDERVENARRERLEARIDVEKEIERATSGGHSPTQGS